MQKLLLHCRTIVQQSLVALLATVIVCGLGFSSAHAAQVMNTKSEEAAPAAAPAEGDKAENTTPAPDASGDKPAESADAAKPEGTDPTKGGGGAGDLLIAPTRVVLDDKKRSMEVSLSNRGEKEATYRITLQRMRMLDNGDYEEVKDGPKPGEAFADEAVRYSPHQVTLKPGQMQSVKFAVKNLGALANGEYRIHAMFRGNPDESKGQDIERTTANNDQINVRLIPVYGVTIPVIVRHGDLNATAGITGAHKRGKIVSLTLTRQGNRSLFGDVIVTAKKGSDEVTVGQLRGVAVYVPNSKRTVNVDLTPPDGTDMSHLSVSYRQRVEEGGKIMVQTAVGGEG